MNIYYFILDCFVLFLFLHLYHNKYSLTYKKIFYYNYFILHVSASIQQNVQNKSVYKIIISRVIFINEFKINLNE